MFKYLENVSYPETYRNKITEEQEQNLLNWFNTKYNMYKKGLIASVNHDSEVQAYGDNLRKRMSNEINIALTICECLGIYVSNSWVGHEGEFFLVTAEDAAQQADFLSMED